MPQASLGDVAPSRISGIATVSSLPCLEDAIKKGEVGERRDGGYERDGETEGRHPDEEAFQVSAVVSRLRGPLCFSRCSRSQHSLSLSADLCPLSHPRVSVPHEDFRDRAAPTDGAH